KDIADQQKEVMAEAKARGFDTKALRQLIALRKKDPEQISEEEAVLQLYREALNI
ncbi:MAG: GapR family DNA-binding domain-containing protein, partial [Pseudomonadota bacterium]